jgi:hypothetical protein
VSKCKTEVAGPIEVKAKEISSWFEPQRRVETDPVLVHAIIEYAILFARELDEINAKLDTVVEKKQGRSLRGMGIGWDEY